MSFRAQIGLLVFPGDGIFAIEEHFSLFPFPRGEELSFRAQIGLLVFPGDGIFALEEHFASVVFRQVILSLCVGGFVVFLQENNLCMFTVLFITFSGVALGYLARKVEWVKFLPKGITYTIWLLLFFFGMQVGGNDQLISNLDSLGFKALLISVAGVLGSSLVAWILSRSILKSFVGLAAVNIAEDTGNAESPHTGSSRVLQFMGGFVIVAFFAAGALLGWLDWVPNVLADGGFSIYVLYALMIQVGMSIGSDSKLKEIVGTMNPSFLLLPAGTIIGTLLAVALVGIFIGGLTLPDTMAVGAGFGYYSLSSVLITEIKSASSGADIAAQLGTIALMSNILREVIVLLFAPLLCRVFGRLAPIASGGATSMDSTLPVITTVCGKELAFVSIFHGILVDFSVPFLVTLFASI